MATQHYDSLSINPSLDHPATPPPPYTSDTEDDVDTKDTIKITLNTPRQIRGNNNTLHLSSSHHLDATRLSTALMTALRSHRHHNHHHRTNNPHRNSLRPRRPRRPLSIDITINNPITILGNANTLVSHPSSPSENLSPSTPLPKNIPQPTLPIQRPSAAAVLARTRLMHATALQIYAMAPTGQVTPAMVRVGIAAAKTMLREIDAAKGVGEGGD